jgi:hypothetical protein
MPHTIDADLVRTIFNLYAYGINSTIRQASIKLITIECQKRGLRKYLHSKRNANKLLKEEAYLGEKTTNK